MHKWIAGSVPSKARNCAARPFALWNLILAHLQLSSFWASDQDSAIKLYKYIVAIGKPERQVRKASHCGSKRQQRWYAAIIVLLPVCATYIWVLFFVNIPFVVNRTFNTTPKERLQQYKHWKCRKTEKECKLNVHFVRILITFCTILKIHKVCNSFETLQAQS